MNLIANIDLLSQVEAADSSSTSVGMGLGMKECAICSDTSHGVHFGVVVCRACAAFFRRSAISGRTYVCRFGGNCEVSKKGVSFYLLHKRDLSMGSNWHHIFANRVQIALKGLVII